MSETAFHWCGPLARLARGGFLLVALVAGATGQNYQDTIREAGARDAVVFILGYDPVTAPGNYKAYREVEIALNKAGYPVKIAVSGTRATDEAKYFKVANFRPEQVAPGGEVTLTVWHIPAPNLVGQGAGTESQRNKLKADWEKYGIIVELKPEPELGTTPAQWGQIHKQEPAPRTLLGPGARITAHYYVNPAGAHPSEPEEKPVPAPAPVRVRRPDIGGNDRKLTRANIDALHKFSDAKFTIYPEFTENRNEDRRIIESLPPLQVPKDTQIVVRYYVYAPLVPNLTGLRLEEAKALAKTFSLRVSGPEADDAQVTGQEPAAGERLPLKDALLPTGFPGPREIRLQTSAPAGTTGLPAGTEPPAGEELPDLKGERRETAHGKPAEKSLDLLDILLWGMVIIAILALLILLVAELSRRRRHGPRKSRAERLPLAVEPVPADKNLTSKEPGSMDLAREIEELKRKVARFEQSAKPEEPKEPEPEPDLTEQLVAAPEPPEELFNAGLLNEEARREFRTRYKPRPVEVSAVGQPGLGLLLTEASRGNLLVITAGERWLLFPSFGASRWQLKDLMQCYEIDRRQPTADNPGFLQRVRQAADCLAVEQGWQLSGKGVVVVGI